MGADVTVLLAQPDNDPPHPWLDEGTQWALPAYIEPTPTDAPPTLLPLLATVGSRAGRHLLIDLQRLGTVHIVGDIPAGRDLLRHIVCELACATWSADVTILLAGFGEETSLLTDIAPDRIRPADDPATQPHGPAPLAARPPRRRRPQRHRNAAPQARSRPHRHPHPRRPGSHPRRPHPDRHRRGNPGA